MRLKPLLDLARLQGMLSPLPECPIRVDAQKIPEDFLEGFRERDSAVELRQEDVFTHKPAEPYDYAVASMCFHHFSDDQILAIIQRLRSFVIDSLLINDLRRSPMASLAAGVLLACLSGRVIPHSMKSANRIFYLFKQETKQSVLCRKLSETLRSIFRLN